MKKNYFNFLIITLITSLTISFILPFNYIYADADDEDYIINSSNDFNTPIYIYNSSDYIRSGIVQCTGQAAGGQFYGGPNNYLSGSRIAYFRDGSTYIYLFARSSSYYYSPIYFGYYSDTGSFMGGTFNRTYGDYTVSSNTVYWVKFSSTQNTSVPEIFKQSSNNTYNDSFCNKVAYDMVFNASEPIVITPGLLTYNYYTDFASNSQTTINAMKSNKDTITWDYEFTDSNISALDLKVDIRAIPVNYYSATESDLKTLSWNNLNINASLYADLGSYHINYNMRKVSYTWEEVVDKIKYISNLPDIYNNLVNDWNFKIFNLNNYYYWTGWVYQIRLNTDSGDYVGEWQTIYQVSSAPPDDSSTVINYYVNGTGVTEPIYQTIQNINNQNNITNNTWYVNGSPFNVDDDSASNWWEQLLQFIRDIVAEILGFLGSIFDTLVSAILELVNSLGIDFLGLITQIINGIVNFFNNLDLTSSNFVLPSSFNNLIQSLSGSTNGILNIWFNNGLGMFIMIPLIIWLIGVVL